MKNNYKPERILGAIFLIDFAVSITAMITGIMVKQKCFVAGSFGETMINIANNPWLMRANIFGETFTAITLLVLAGFLFIILKKKNEKTAISALLLYILGASLLLASRIPAFEFLRISEYYKANGSPANLVPIAELLFNSTEFAITLIGIPLCIGLLMFFVLFYRSKMIPAFLSLWGIIASAVLIIAAFIGVSGYSIPLYLYLPYAPLEPVLGIWILMKGLNKNEGSING